MTCTTRDFSRLNLAEKLGQLYDKNCKKKEEPGHIPQALFQIFILIWFTPSDATKIGEFG